MLLRADLPPVAMLVNLHSPASATEFVTATREILIGCVKWSPGFVRKVSCVVNCYTFMWLHKSLRTFPYFNLK